MIIVSSDYCKKSTEVPELHKNTKLGNHIFKDSQNITGDTKTHIKNQPFAVETFQTFDPILCHLYNVSQTHLGTQSSTLVFVLTCLLYLMETFC